MHFVEKHKHKHNFVCRSLQRAAVSEDESIDFQ